MLLTHRHLSNSYCHHDGDGQRQHFVVHHGKAFDGRYDLNSVDAMLTRDENSLL